MSVYDLLKKYQKDKHAFERTEEYEFFIKNRDLLNKMSRFDFLFNKENFEFDVLRGYIILKAYFNKQTIELETKNILSHSEVNNKNLLSILKEKIVDLPYLIYDKTKIYVPFFNVPLNAIYSKNPEKLLDYPYSELEKEFSSSIIDSFDVYGVSLYDSYFTRLIKIKECNNQVAFFNYDTNTIYIINNQGRLDTMIPLFDKFMKKMTTNHMLERLKPVIDAYFNDDKDQFILSLKENNFISDKLYNIITN